MTQIINQHYSSWYFGIFTDSTMRTYFKFFLSIIIVLWALSDIQAQDKPIIHYEGSSTIANFIKDAESVYGKVKFELKTETESAGGEISILEGTADIGGVAKVPSPQVLGKGVVSTLIGWDAIAVIVNANNPIKNLTKEQLRGIFTSKITNWNELGGPDLLVKPYIVNEESATRNVFRSRILGQEDYVNCETITPDSEITTKVSMDEGGIGQISFSFINNQNTKINLLSINGQKASVNNQSYPITRPLYLLWWPGRKLTSDFADWTQTKEAQSIITKRFIGKTQEAIEEMGKLIVFTKTESIEEGGTYFYPHEPYEIYSKDGVFLQYVDNRLEPTDENPSIVNLEPNQYLIWTATAKKNGNTKVLVNIDPNVTTRVSIDSDNTKGLKSSTPSTNALKQLSLFGDFRFRFEQDWKSLNQDGNYRSDRGRFRYRLRFGFNYKLNEHIIFGGRLRSGDIRNNQSPHVTLGSEIKDHGIAIDKAYAKVNMTNWWFWMGKNNLPFWKENEIWWDDDITPEGIAIGSNIDKFDRIKIIPTFGYFLLNNLGGQLNENSFFTGGQLKFEILFDKVELNVGSGYYMYSDVPDKNDELGLHTLNYKIINSLLQVKFKTKIPITIGLDNYISLEDYNDDPFITENQLEKEKVGYVLSFQAGSLSEKGNVLFSYYYSYIPKYAVVDYLAQDDWLRWNLGNAVGTRSSNFKGHELRLAYSFGKGFNVIVRTYFVKSIKKENINQKALETNNRFRVDFNFKF